jgi:hypothetical protein
MSTFLYDLEAGIVAAVTADPDVAGITVTTSQTDEVKETLSAFVALEHSREVVAGSRIFILDGNLALRINRSQYSADEAAAAVQNVTAAFLNAPAGENGFDAFSNGSAKCIGFVMGAQNTNYKDEVEIHVFSFKIWAYQLST